MKRLSAVTPPRGWRRRTHDRASARQVAVITDRDVRLAGVRRDRSITSSAYGKEAIDAGAGQRRYEAYNEWLHYSEGSAMLPLMHEPLCLPAEERARRSIRASTARSPIIWLCRWRARGPRVLRRTVAVGADIQMSFVGEMESIRENSGRIRTSRLADPHARTAGVQRSVEKVGYRFGK